MRKSIHLALALSGMLAVAACSSSGGSGSSSGPVGLVQVGAYTGDQAFEAQFAASIDYPALYAVKGRRHPRPSGVADPGGYPQ